MGAGGPQGGAGGAQPRAFAGRGVRLGGMWDHHI
jgi:hypothetical protein